MSAYGEPAPAAEGADDSDERGGIRVTSHAEMLYLSTVRLLIERAGTVRPEAASGFLVAHKEERFVVTARHVVDGAGRITLHLYTGDSVHTMGAPLSYDLNPDEWTFHPDASVDVAVAAFEPVAEHFGRLDQAFTVNALKTSDFQPKSEPGNESFTDKFWHPLPLDEVLIVGYPQDYRDVPTSLPVLRRGRIATPLWLDHEGRPVFLVDTAATHGASGGPVAYVEEEHHVGKTMYEGTGKVVLLGVFSEVFPPRARVVTAAEGQPQRPPGLGAAYKAHTVLETIEEFLARNRA